MLGEEEARLEFLFEVVTGISKEKCNRVFEKFTVCEIVTNPILFEGTVAQTRKIEFLGELIGSYKNKDLYYTNKQISSPKEAIDIFENRMLDMDHEELHMLLLDARNRIIKTEIVAIGGLSGAAFYPRKIVKEAIKYNAAKIIISHNHPSGDSKASPDDINTTKSLNAALATFGIELMDHLIVGSKGHSYSFKEMGNLI